MSVFVTVGSTSFDDLIEHVSSSAILQILADNDFQQIVFQIGRGLFIPNESPIINVSWFRYKDSIHDNIAASSLVIGHAGAGTILESLIEQKPLIAVFNDKLMNQHQNELAEQMGKEGFLLHCGCDGIEETLKRYFKDRKLTPFVSEPNMFSAYLKNFVGLTSK